MICSNILDTVSLRMPSGSIRDYSGVLVYRSSTASPSARCVYAANVICKIIEDFVLLQFICCVIKIFYLYTYIFLFYFILLAYVFGFDL
jgi:hypothetical protein